MQENKCQHQSDDTAQLVNGHALRGFPDLQSFIVAQPGSARRKTGQNQEDPAFLADGFDAALRVVRNTMSQAITTTTTVRIAVARLEFTPSMPMAVSWTLFLLLPTFTIAH